MYQYDQVARCYRQVRHFGQIHIPVVRTVPRPESDPKRAYFTPFVYVCDFMACKGFNRNFVEAEPLKEKRQLQKDFQVRLSQRLPRGIGVPRLFQRRQVWDVE